ncbi:MAG: DNA repair protein RadC [Lachnospiraceae bacterium]|nr:DNA repair protein RadC [Lachnospiraceae bacterium]
MTKRKTVKELPKTERPYEKCYGKGAEYLSDAELLAVILRTGTNGIRSIELAQEILDRQENGLLNLYDLSKEELMNIPGIGKVKAVQLKCIAELSKRMSRLSLQEKVILNDAKTVAEYYMEQMRHETKEILMVSLFTNKGRLIAEEVVSVGTINSSIVSPREIFYTAIIHNAAYLILLHNHPSGDPSPSANDHMVTEHVLECGQYMNIQLADHIIIGDNSYYSFRENGLI